uniref:Uncharacterized protein n=1 Tax=Sphaerodactylus townsendi TaxID=933632 RepID=A0ACB8ENY9_9SAUR
MSPLAAWLWLLGVAACVSGEDSVPLPATDAREVQCAYIVCAKCARLLVTHMEKESVQKPFECRVFRSVLLKRHLVLCSVCTKACLWGDLALPIINSAYHVIGGIAMEMVELKAGDPGFSVSLADMGLGWAARLVLRLSKSQLAARVKQI